MTVPACAASLLLNVVRKAVAYIGNTTITTDLTTYTFPNHAIGTPSGDRRVHVLVMGGGVGNSTVSTVTVGGISALINAQTNENSQVAAIATAWVPTGTTGDIVVTFAGGKARCNVGVYASVGLLSNVAYDADTSGADPATATLSTLPGGFCIAFATNDNNSSTVAWTNVSEDYDANPESNGTCSGANAATTGADISPSGDMSSSGTNQASAFVTF